MRLISSNLTDADNELSFITTEVITDYTKWVIASRDNIQVTVEDGIIRTSTDAGETFTYSIAFALADEIIGSWIFPNGNILLILQQRLFMTDVSLQSVNERIMLNKDGVTEYPTPLTGSYFGNLSYNAYNNTSDMFVWVNYANVTLGTGIPIAVYYSKDFGATFKVAFAFDDVPQEARHGHSVDYNPFNDKWYMTTGDFPILNGGQYQSMWWEGSHDPILDEWTWNVIDFGFPIEKPSNLKANAFYFTQVDGIDYIYWGAETNGNEPQYRGIWKSPIIGFNNIANHVRVLDISVDGTYKVNAMRVDYNTGIVTCIVATEEINNATDSVMIVKDFGEGDYSIKQFVGMRLRGATSANSKGFVRYDTEFRDTLQTKSFFVKAGSNLWVDWIDTVIT